VQRGRVRDFYHDRRRMPAEMEPSSDHNRLAVNLRAHCERQIPGYMGHVPRIHGESVYGATKAAANRIAADLCEDKVFNPEDHIRNCCEPQAPDPRKLRM